MLLNIFSFYTNSCGSRILSPVFTPPSPHTHTHKHSASRLNFYLSVFLINLWWTGTVLRWSKYYENPKWNHNTIIYIYCKRLFANLRQQVAYVEKKLFLYIYYVYPCNFSFLLIKQKWKWKFWVWQMSKFSLIVND